MGIMTHRRKWECISQGGSIETGKGWGWEWTGDYSRGDYDSSNRKRKWDSLVNLGLVIESGVGVEWVK